MDQPNKPYKAIGERLEKFRQYLGISRKELAEVIGAKVTHVNNLIGGHKLLSNRHMIILINHYPQLNCNWLLVGAGEMLFVDPKDVFDKEIYKLQVENELLLKLLQSKDAKED